jgi:uncharacterized protein (TIGR02391 family)
MPYTLEQLIKAGTNLLSETSNTLLAHKAHERWSKDVLDWLQQNAPDSGLSARWASIGPSPLIQGSHYYDDPISRGKYGELVRSQLRWLGKEGPVIAQQRARISNSAGLWDLLHPKIRDSAKERYNAGLYADAVEAVLKALNAEVRARVLSKGGPELDGASLMNTAFSPKNPIIVLEDLATQSGRDAQLGYMQIFAGAMTGIRNPKAHDNLHITEVRALHFLFLASLLWIKLDESQ